MANQIYLDKSLEIYEQIISIQVFKNYKDYINSFKINLKSSKVFKKNPKLSMVHLFYLIPYVNTEVTIS